MESRGSRSGLGARTAAYAPPYNESRKQLFNRRPPGRLCLKELPARGHPASTGNQANLCCDRVRTERVSILCAQTYFG
jgi:hypothetical protein